MAHLDQIRTPADLAALSVEELRNLAAEIRESIVEAVGNNGGHLASNMGVVELTLALHRVFSFGPFPQGPDRLLFDVGHQCYVHKMLTGRAANMPSLRRRGSVSGFPSPAESPYDLFNVGHAGTAISTGMGIAKADAMLGRQSNVVCVVGDASMVNGLAMEGLNSAGMLKRQFLIVLNDNGMAISKPQGSMAHLMERIRLSTTYDDFKRRAAKLVQRLPMTVGHGVEAMWDHFRQGLKLAVWPGHFFESLNLKYMGPIDGHDLPMLLHVLSEVKDHPSPVLLHVLTHKGHGCPAAVSQPTRFHSPDSYLIEGETLTLSPSKGESFTQAFSKALVAEGRRRNNLVAMTAAMPDGTGLRAFESEFPGRMSDVGICESHLVAKAAGMCKMGLRPVVAVYSTFAQRCFDQVFQEVALQGLPVVFALDRAGLVGSDGAVHHGAMDLAFMRPLPGMVLLAPSDGAEMARALELACTLETPSAIRYPRDFTPTPAFEERVSPDLAGGAAAAWRVGVSRRLLAGRDGTFLVLGALVSSAWDACEALRQEGIEMGLVDARFAKPLDSSMVRQLVESGTLIVTVEDHSLQAGFGSAVLEEACRQGLETRNIIRLGLPDRFVGHATRAQQLQECGLDATGLASCVRDALRARSGAAEPSPVGTQSR